MAALGGLCSVGCSAYDSGLLETQSSGLASAATAGAAPVAPQPNAPPPSNVMTAELPVATRCGDGLITGAEKCDLGIDFGEPGACPIACPPLAACAPRVLNGIACQAECVLLAPSCTDGDGCCPGNCVADNDDDCSASCGNGIVEPDLGETCEAGGQQPCKISAEACDDGDACTADTLIGSAKNCNAECLAVPITTLDADGCCPGGADANTDEDCEPICGNGVREGSEECDGSDSCTADCRIMLQPEQLVCLESASDECQRCTCLQCSSEHLACRSGPDAVQNALCAAVVDCSRREQCVGTPCYCGAPPVCGVPRGPCQTEIEAAAGTVDVWQITAQRQDPATTLGKAWAYSACRALHCAAVCKPPAAN